MWASAELLGFGPWPLFTHSSPFGLVISPSAGRIDDQPFGWIMRYHSARRSFLGSTSVDFCLAETMDHSGVGQHCNLMKVKATFSKGKVSISEAVGSLCLYYDYSESFLIFEPSGSESLFPFFSLSYNLSRTQDVGSCTC